MPWFRGCAMRFTHTPFAQCWYAHSCLLSALLLPPQWPHLSPRTYSVATPVRLAYCWGVGAVVGALLINTFRARFSTAKAYSMLALLNGFALIAVGLSRSLPLTCLGMFLAGGATMLTISLLNISVQLSAPRWVTARALSLFSSLLTGGVAFGAWFWGIVANHWAIDTAIIASGVMMLTLPLITMFLTLPEASQAGAEAVDIENEPEVGLAITMRSGPIVIEIEYHVEPEDPRAFYTAMQEVRNFPTWGDYLRMRDRFTQADLDAQSAANALTVDGKIAGVRRGLERPFGSVRWKENTPDPKQESVVFMGP